MRSPARRTKPAAAILLHPQRKKSTPRWITLLI
nr:MAG TPA: hypothetical protein [Caudoviricetes sp.]